MESVLFICEDNSILSPIAEAFLRRYGKFNFEAHSAGIEKRAIHLYVFQVMEEIGYDLYGYHAKSIFDLNHLQRVDYLITLTDTVHNNFIYNKDHIGVQLHWPFKNPLLAPDQPVNFIPATGAQSLAAELWHPTGSLLIKTSSRTRVIFQLPDQDIPPKDVKEIRARFRRIRDEIEVQVMNWLEEKGSGPLWWNR